MNTTIELNLNFRQDAGSKSHEYMRLSKEKIERTSSPSVIHFFQCNAEDGDQQWNAQIRGKVRCATWNF